MILIDKIFYGIETIGPWKGKLCLIIYLSEDKLKCEDIFDSKTFAKRIVYEHLKTGVERFVITGNVNNDIIEAIKMVNNTEKEIKNIKFNIQCGTKETKEHIRNVVYISDNIKFLGLNDFLYLDINKTCDLEEVKNISEKYLFLNIIVSSKTIDTKKMIDFVIVNHLKNIEVCLNDSLVYPTKITGI